MPVEIESMDHYEKIVAEAGDKAIIIDFHATWCGPCKMIAPALGEMAKTYSNVVVIKVDVDEVDELAAKFEVQCMPTFIVVKNGQKVDFISGANKEKLEDLFKKYN